MYLKVSSRIAEAIVRILHETNRSFHIPKCLATNCVPWSWSINNDFIFTLFSQIYTWDSLLDFKWIQKTYLYSWLSPKLFNIFFNKIKTPIVHENYEHMIVTCKKFHLKKHILQIMYHVIAYIKMNNIFNDNKLDSLKKFQK